MKNLRETEGEKERGKERKDWEKLREGETATLPWDSGKFGRSQEEGVCVCVCLERERERGDLRNIC